MEVLKTAVKQTTLRKTFSVTLSVPTTTSFFDLFLAFTDFLPLIDIYFCYFWFIQDTNISTSFSVYFYPHKL